MALIYNFSLDATSKKMFDGMGLNAERVFREVGIPHRAIEHGKIELTQDQYKRLIEVFDKNVDINFVTEFSKIDSLSMFIPEFFAGLCASNGEKCINRIAKYKKIIAPIDVEVIKTENSISLNYSYNDGEIMPRMMILNAQVGMLSIIRQGTGIYDIKPIKVLSEYDYPENAKEYFGVDTIKNTRNELVFNIDDLQCPFITENNKMWEYLQGELNQRLTEIETDTSLSASVRKSLIELIPSGVSTADQIASELNVSKRTLQRKLKDEETTFNEQLNHTRELLVRNYLKTNMTLDEIAFLVNYSDSKSLTRAFKLWTGFSVSEYRKKYI